MLVDFINQTHFGQYDFLYLRMDFKNKCNVGYAFINFTEPLSVQSFYYRINGKKWKNFSSGKIAELTYATVQGFDNLVRKFRNSSIMGRIKCLDLRFSTGMGHYAASRRVNLNKS
ncbi:uncharacterized protein VICG_01979 [Vittaforma corneae ATCC 50505]|uniref:Mei2-like C-terminal RNA recognition motif domain-containing protein n=1 Tax=Vittaforma corneae (strain ATCC 50505) TaxID=993615 RepID=L2GKI4_VITCO|nr:uncharacterized protein VICG_01979 [Vittaforma corneae ATCC 50505]ELA41020.1 hypothetical protein VICG_01979 [Vittaforma corneae ATCC 50505]